MNKNDNQIFDVANWLLITHIQIANDLLIYIYDNLFSAHF